MEAVNQTCIHHEVHTSMPHFSTSFTILLDNGVLILFFKFLRFCIGQETMTTEIVNLGRNTTFLKLLAIKSKLRLWILCCISLSTRQLKEAIVWLRVHYIVLNLYNLSISSAHQRSCMVTITIIVARFTRGFLHVFLTMHRLSIHCC